MRHDRIGDIISRTDIFTPPDEGERDRSRQRSSRPTEGPRSVVDYSSWPAPPERGMSCGPHDTGQGNVTHKRSSSSGLPDTAIRRPPGPGGAQRPFPCGAGLAGRHRRIVLLIGDGAAQFTVQELGTLARERLTPAVVVADNAGYPVERASAGPMPLTTTSSAGAGSMFLGRWAWTTGSRFGRAPTANSTTRSPPRRPRRIGWCSSRPSYQDGYPGAVHRTGGVCGGRERRHACVREPIVITASIHTA